MNILLVEDDVTLAQSVAEAIRARGWHVDVSHRGEPVAKSVLQDDYDALVLDIGLPGIDGYEVARRLRARPETAGALIVAVTGYGQKEDRERSRAAGFDHHLVKPVDTRKLAGILDKVVVA